MRFDYTPSNNEAYIVYKKLVDIILSYDLKVIGILPSNNYKDIIDMCDGVILSGGDKSLDIDLEIIKYIHDKDIPCLGICMGMQEMGILYGGYLKKVDNHMEKHYIEIKNSSIYEDGIMKVNSRHHEAVFDTNLEVTASSDVIEMIEDKNKKFFVGVQWHPEDMKHDKLFDIFIKSVKKSL